LFSYLFTPCANFNFTGSYCPPRPRNTAQLDDIREVIESIRTDKEVIESIRNDLSEVARKLKPRDSGPTKTPASRGKEQLRNLRSAKAITPAYLDPSSPPILSPDTLKQLHEDLASASISPTEAVLTALLTPSITLIVQEVANETQSGLVLSNTEYIKWLPPWSNSDHNEWKKPDLITAHPAMLISRKQNGGEGIIKFRNSRADWRASKYYFGSVEAKKESIGFISSLWEGKGTIGNMNEALGEMVDYVKCFVVDKSMISFILYDKFGFIGGCTITGTITELVVREDNESSGPAVIPWDAHGSKDVLKNLLKKRIPEKMVLMEKVRYAFNASWKSRGGNGTSPHLGSGGFGDVYCVEIEGKVQALKVIRDKYSKGEFDTLKQAYNDKAPVVEVLVENHNDSFFAYTMRPVGTPCSDHTPEIVSLLFSALFDLHKTGWYHGDARWQNAILFDNKVHWCDFLQAKKLVPLDIYNRACDLHTLAESLSSRPAVATPISKIEEMLERDMTSYTEIAIVVTNNKNLPPSRRPANL
jgi:hypothetical protein